MAAEVAVSYCWLVQDLAPECGQRCLTNLSWGRRGKTRAHFQTPSPPSQQEFRGCETGWYNVDNKFEVLMCVVVWVVNQK